MAIHCAICDLPSTPPDGKEPWQGNRDLCCERFYLSGMGLENEAANRRCILKGQNWRSRYLQEVAKNQELEQALACARSALSRHHAAQHRQTDPFPDNARIE